MEGPHLVEGCLLIYVTDRLEERSDLNRIALAISQFKNHCKEGSH